MATRCYLCHPSSFTAHLPSLFGVYVVGGELDEILLRNSLSAIANIFLETPATLGRQISSFA